MRIEHWIRMGRASAIAFALLCCGAVPAAAASLDAGVQQHIRAATFEVVQLKPEEGAVTYERALPLELLPFQERNDKYRSIGTAFAIGPNSYVTAGHVFALGAGSQYGEPSLRDAAGKVYAIDKVIKYSDQEDFVEFSLRQQPAGIQPLDLGDKPALNDAVYAVGNALGEGVVIRDGVYTSDTPEELEGKWNWLRFTAAASPGNSGGPLVNQDGKVVGVVLRKSESENLNYALPIAQVRSASDGQGSVDSRASMRLPIMDVAETFEIHEHFSLPKTPAEVYAALVSISAHRLDEARTQLLAHNAAHLFPHGAGSDQLLSQPVNMPFPALIYENQDKLWMVGESKPQEFQLDGNGYVSIANGLVRLRIPDGMSLATLYGDSKLTMDLMLKGLGLQRQVGTDAVKVTSLGKAVQQSSYSDSYGRVWQVLVWNVPYQDISIIGLMLPTPQGYTGLLVPMATGFRQLGIAQQECLTDYLYVTYAATFAQWRDFLAQQGMQPKIFSSFKFDIGSDQHIQLRSKRWQLDVTPDLVPLSHDSLLALNTDFFKDGDTVVYDVAAVSVRESTQHGGSVDFMRYSAPPTALPERFQSAWDKLIHDQYPFDGKIVNGNGTTRIAIGVPTAAAGADTQSGGGAAPGVHYALRVIADGDQTQDAMSPKLDLLRRSFTMLEH